MPGLPRWMIISFISTLTFSILVGYFEQDAKAQAGRQVKSTQRPARRALGPAQVLAIRFDRSAPQIGDALPGASGFDPNGNEFKLQSLKGHYTVLTFGCLT